ncbi:MAG: nicotinate (nicotinamide) nucleotide adenylyltransferase [Elusimicrobiota bacterium]
MSYILYGGVFDPPHRGHLAIAGEAYKIVKPDRVIWVPARRPPHREVEGLGARERYNLVNLLIEKNDNFKLSDIELKGEHSGYTVETIEKFRQKFPREKSYLLIGTDEAEQFKSWKDWRKILKLTGLIIGRRKKTDNIPPQIKSRALLLKNKIWDISSSELRQLFRQGKAPKEKVPEKVREYIISRNLYSG